MKKILVLNLLFMNAFADENINKAQEVSNILAQNSYEPNYFGMVLGLFLVIGMIYITGFLYQKLTKANTFNQNSYINKAQVISTTSIGQGRNLHVVKIGQSACLIGSTQNNITFLKDIEIQEEAGEKNGENS
ncbi:MAG: FliO/MopB family protein [Candidatus Gastranaerophilales bacterium]|nr:FliO/MopB family protein [Candidatus Gastranaerophilales bacterium]